MEVKMLAPNLRVEILPGLPANVPIFQFTDKPGRIYSEGYVIHVISEEYGDWIGNIQRCRLPTFFFGVYNHPNEDHICVVSSGEAYIII